MQLKKTLGFLLGALATLSGILSLPYNLGRITAWLSAVGVSIGIDFVRIILYVGIALFPVYLAANAILYFRRISFEAEIVDKKEFEVGETVFFKVRFRGNLKNGFFDTMIKAPEGKHLPDGSDHIWCWDRETLPDSYPNTPGKLHGFVVKASTWGWPIPLEYPTGEYTLYIRVYDHLGVGNRPVIREKKEIITIVSRI